MPELTIEPLKPEEALRYWGGKMPVTQAEFERLSEQAKQRAFYVSGLAKQDQVNLVHGALRQALEEGETLADFKRRAKDLIEEQGWTDRRIATIYQTNLQTAYMAGQWQSFEDNKEAQPFLEYLAIADKRTRPEHMAMNGLVYPVDHEFWRFNYPLNGFRCRCDVRALSERQLKKAGKTVQREMPGPTVLKDPKTGMERYVAAPGASRGFHGNVGRDWLTGLSPGPVEGTVEYPKPLTLCPRGRGDFAEKGDACGLPLSAIEQRHILPVSAADIMAKGLKPEEYVLAFLKEFGLSGIDERKIITLPKVKLPVVVSKELFINKNDRSWKVDKRGREQYVKLLARTIKNPFEIWQVPAHLAGRPMEVLRLLRLFRTESGTVGGFAVFNLIAGRRWDGATAFTPKSDAQKASVIDYLEKQRVGMLIYREE